MSTIDWTIMFLFLAAVTAYGIWKTSGKTDLEDYFLANRTTPWYTITFSIMATQASAITFLSTPGQAYVDGMRFVQFYFGLPLAMIILSVTAVPIYHKLKVFTAYEYLEQRFDLKNRTLGSALFLTQRGLAAGFTIFAPALIISVLLGWNIQLTIILIGILVIMYTASGGTEAVNKTHMFQMVIILAGMVMAFAMIIHLLPADISFLDATRVAGKMGKLNAIDFSFNWRDRYNFWSGLIGGTFLALSYFGTDQSQVQRYLSGRSIAESRLGLLANGLIKIPMQFFILFIGAMIFVFYQFQTPPLLFNPVETERIESSVHAETYEELELRHFELYEQKQEHLRDALSAIETDNDEALEYALEDIAAIRASEREVKQEVTKLQQKVDPDADIHDTNYIFLSFVINFLPVGLIGLILAAILSASMSSTAAELNALATTTVIDIYKRIFKQDASEKHYLFVSKLATVFWGLYAITFALYANRLGSLIEAVNILGSLFYGTILGIFLVAFYLKNIGGNATFISAIIAELVVLGCFFFTEIPYLWYNVIGCIVLVAIATILSATFFRAAPKPS